MSYYTECAHCNFDISKGILNTNYFETKDGYICHSCINCDRCGEKNIRYTKLNEDFFQLKDTTFRCFSCSICCKCELSLVTKTRNKDFFDMGVIKGLYCKNCVNNKNSRSKKSSDNIFSVRLGSMPSSSTSSCQSSTKNSTQSSRSGSPIRRRSKLNKLTSKINFSGSRNKSKSVNENDDFFNEVSKQIKSIDTLSITQNDVIIHEKHNKIKSSDGSSSVTTNSPTDIARTKKTFIDKFLTKSKK